MAGSTWTDRQRVCDVIKVDEFYAQAVYGGGDGTQAVARVVGVCSWATCVRSKVCREDARTCRRHAASTHEGSGHTGAV